MYRQNGNKESFHTLHPRAPSGNDFRMLGVCFDTKLVMRNACYEIASIAVGRRHAVLKLRSFFTTVEIINHYKSQVLFSIDFTTLAIYHSPESFLRVIDDVQHNFLNEMGLSQGEAFTNFNLAPLNVRKYKYVRLVASRCVR